MTRLSNDERAALVDSARSLLSTGAGPTSARGLLDDPVGFDRALFQEMCALGWGAMHLPESHGGHGAAIADIAGVWSELGRSLTAGPLIGSSVVAAGTLLAADNDHLTADLMSDLASGDRLATVASCGPVGHPTPAGVGPTWVAKGFDVLLSNAAFFVPDAHVADWVFCFASDSVGELVAVAVPVDDPGVSIQVTQPVDHTRRLFRVDFDSVVVPARNVLADPSTAVALLEVSLDLGSVALAHDSFGVADVVVENTVGYVSQRHQFGRPVGSFQAIKHRLADNRLSVEASRVAVDEAAETLEAAPGTKERRVGVSNAKAYVTDAATTICGDSIRSHGGIGFTWEHDAHLYLKRAMLNQAMYGTASFHRRRIADAVFGPAS